MKYLIEVCGNCLRGIQGEYITNCAVCDMGGAEIIPYIGDYLIEVEKVAVVEVPQGPTGTVTSSSTATAATYDHNYWDTQAGRTEADAIRETQEFWDSRGGSPF